MHNPINPLRIAGYARVQTFDTCHVDSNLFRVGPALMKYMHAAGFAELMFRGHGSELIQAKILRALLYAQIINTARHSGGVFPATK